MKTCTLFLVSLLLFAQCARISQPQGGPKDEDDPKLLNSVPANGQKNYKGSSIILTFDEYIKLKDPQEEIVITPSAGPKTKITSKKNTLTIAPEKKWQDTTTYSIAFRGSVQDLNEGNIAEDLHLSFSTGPVIDSLKIYGSIKELFKDKVPQKITVAVYQSDTFDIFKHKAVYVTKANKMGRFSMQNLKPGKYYLYAFDDKNKNFKVDSKSERFGFLALPINIPERQDSCIISLFHVDTRPIKVINVRNTNTITIIRFNKALSKAKLKSDTSSFIYSYGENQSEIIIYKNFNQKDSLKVNINAYDSIQQELDTAVYIKYTDNKKIEEKFKISAWITNYDPETKTFQTSASINKLLKTVNYDSIYIQLDTTSYQNITPENIRFDTIRKKITIKSGLQISDKENNPHPILLFGKGSFISIDNDSTKSTDIKINLVKQTETGTLSIEIQTTEPHFEMQLQDVNSTIIKSIRDEKKITLKYLPPAEYKIVILVDKNNNHLWDPGSFSKKQEPENVILYKNSENKYQFPIRANWEVGPLVITF